MDTMKTTVAAVMLIGFFATANAYTHHMGACPDVTPVNEFDMEKFLGYWYVVEKTSKDTRCDGFNYTRGSGVVEYYTTQDTDRNLFGISSSTYRTHYVGELSVPDSKTPARMDVRYPLNIIGSASYIIFATDYDNYAGVFICQKFQFAHRRNIAILSRTRELDSVTLIKLHQQLEDFGVDSGRLNTISQSECDNVDNIVELNIDSHTFTRENIRKFFSDTSMTFQKGAQWVKETTNFVNSIYHNIWGSYSEDSDEHDTSTIEYGNNFESKRNNFLD